MWDMVRVSPTMLTEVLDGLSAAGWTIFSISYNDISRDYTVIMNRGIKND